jgi:hypothetical protein
MCWNAIGRSRYQPIFSSESPNQELLCHISRQTGNVVLSIESAAAWVDGMNTILWQDEDDPPENCTHPALDGTHVCTCGSIVTCEKYPCCQPSGDKFDAAFVRAARSER